MYLFLRKHPDRIAEDVLEPAPGSNAASSGAGSIWAKAKGALLGGTGSGGAPAHSAGEDDADDDTINVFTIASGHM
jgi:hypothetical protein